MKMKLSAVKSHDAVRQARRAEDPASAAEADRVALADAVSAAVVRYRSERGLTRTAFAAMLGWKQPQVARLERGDVTSSLETLQRLARAGVIEVRVVQKGAVVRELATA